MIRAVFFDVGGTLIQPWPSVGEVYARVASRYGLEINPAATEAAFRQAWKTVKIGLLTTSRKEWWRELVDHVVPGATDAYFEDLYETFARAEAWRLDPAVPPMLELLRSRGLHVGVISNWDDRLRPLLERLGLRFDSVTVSCEVGAEKPDARIFEVALAAARVSAGEACHIGDSMEEDVRGAERVGMRAILVRDGELRQAVQGI